MKRFATLSLVLALAACGGGEPAESEAGAPEAGAPATEAPATEAAAPTGEMTMPDWFHVDEANRTVHIVVTAGATDALNYWNYNGGHNGNMTVTVPEGYEVTIEFKNADPNMAHSLVIMEKAASWGANVEPQPVFEGAVTENPTSMMDATMPNEEETITFTATTAGEYAMVCVIPGHAATGMWINFNVSSDGTAGVQGAA